MSKKVIGEIPQNLLGEFFGRCAIVKDENAKRYPLSIVTEKLGKIQLNTYARQGMAMEPPAIIFGANVSPTVTEHGAPPVEPEIVPGPREIENAQQHESEPVAEPEPETDPEPESKSFLDVEIF